MLNRELNYFLDLMVGPPPNRNMEQCPIKYIQWVQQAMLNAFTFTHGQLGLAAKRQKRGYERGLKPREYKEGSWVWRWYPLQLHKSWDWGGLDHIWSSNRFPF